MKLGVYSACLPELSPQQAIQAAAAAGYSGIEWRISHEVGSAAPADFLTNNRCTVRPTRAEILDIRERCDRAGMEIIGLNAYLDVGDLTGVEQMMALAVDARTTRIRLRAPAAGHRGFHSSLAEAIVFFRNVAVLAGRHGVQALLEMHQRTVCPSAALAKQVVGHLPPELVGVIYDPGNAVVEGSEEPEMALQILGEHLAHVHIKNTGFERSDDSGPWRHRWTPMDDGILDVPEILRLLDKTGYRDWVSVEDFSTARPSIESLAFNAAYLGRHASFRAVPLSGDER